MYQTMALNCGSFRSTLLILRLMSASNPSRTRQIVVKALWNALRGRHKYGATNGNQYAARRCSTITRLTRNSLTRVRVYSGAAIFAHYIWRSRLLSRSEENKNVVTDLMRQCKHCLHKEGGSVVKALWNALRKRHKYGATSGNQYAARRCSMITRLTWNLSVTG